VLTTDHTVLSANHTFIHKCNEPYLPLLPSRRASLRFGTGRRLSWPEWLVRNWSGLLACRLSPIPVLTGPGVE